MRTATTLAESMQAHAVSFDELGETYKPDLAIVRELIGVVPNCDNHLEIWPPGFRTYNLVVPNFLNVPGSLLGQGAPKDLVGLAMYASSRAASCMYCSAHTCSFALRRGASAGAVTGSDRSPAEQAVVDAAEALSTIPATFDRSHLDDLAAHLDPGDIEWVVLSVAMMGFLNKFMDAVGIELEPQALSDASELIEPTGWTPGQHLWDENIAFDRHAPPPPKDSLGTYARVLRNAPGAIKLDRSWTKGLPSAPHALRRHIADRYRFDEPVLARLTHKRASRATAALLRQNLEPTLSLIGIEAKALAGIIFAVHAGNDDLGRRLKELALGAGASEEMCNECASFAAADPAQSATAKLNLVEPTEAAVARLALAIAPSPAAVSPDMVEMASSTLSPAQTIETAVWISVLQLLHRLHLYLEVKPSG